MTWDGESLRDKLAEELGDQRTAFKSKVLNWINDIQEDLTATFKWPFLKMKMKKLIVAGTTEVDLSPQIPSVPTVAIGAGGALADGAYSIKVTFLIHDETGKEKNSIESEPSEASAVVTSAGGNDTINISALDTYDGSTTILPNQIYRRIYLSKDNGPYYLAKTIQDNTTTTTTITAETTSTIQPPIESMVGKMADEDPFIEASNIQLCSAQIDLLRAYNPGFTSGTPAHYARMSGDKITIYPKPSSDFTLSYYVYKRPSRIFAESSRALQIPSALRQALEYGVIWRGNRYRDRAGQEEKNADYEAKKKLAVQEFKHLNGKPLKVREVE